MKNSLLSIAVLSALLVPGIAEDAKTSNPVPNKPWTQEEIDQLRPTVITPPGFTTNDTAGAPPSDAIVFFDGKDISKLKGSGKNSPNGEFRWKVENGYMEIVKGGGSVVTAEQIEGDCQWHIEWRSPEEVKGDSQGRGNSGVFIGGYPELQVLDSFNNDTYPDGQAGALYKNNPPYVNACRGPGQWQTYDIICLREKKVDGKVVQPASITVLHNGIVVQFAFATGGGAQSGGLSLQDHSNPVRYRNIWARPIRIAPVKR
jgi:hypothetical protein